jgi:hypothetical protein
MDDEPGGAVRADQGDGFEEAGRSSSSAPAVISSVTQAAIVTRRRTLQEVSAARWASAPSSAPDGDRQGSRALTSQAGGGSIGVMSDKIPKSLDAATIASRVFDSAEVQVALLHEAGAFPLREVVRLIMTDDQYWDAFLKAFKTRDKDHQQEAFRQRLFQIRQEYTGPRENTLPGGPPSEAKS